MSLSGTGFKITKREGIATVKRYHERVLMRLPEGLREILRDLDGAGFRAVVVGGAVRDALLGLEPKDFDVEVYGTAYDTLAGFLARYGRVDLVGKAFGVVKLHRPDRSAQDADASVVRGSGWSAQDADASVVRGSGGSAQDADASVVRGFEKSEVDFSVPRRESKIGLRHRDFQTEFDADITPREAASRRDFTINAIAYDPVRDQILDYFGGRQDLENRILRATSEAFREDPLRVLRGMQFACRFDLTLDPATADMCQSIVDEYVTLARERVAEEFMKWAIKSKRPGRIAEYLTRTGWIVHFPEIRALAGVPQDPQWHPEGDVSVHTMLVLDAAARVADRDCLKGDERAVLLFAALAHDFAKATTTAMRERDGRLRWTSFGHESEGGPMARTFLERIGIKGAIIEQVVPLVENHLASSSIGRDATPRAVRRLAMRLAPANITQLLRLIEADYSGRPPLPGGLPESAIRIREMAQAQAVEQRPQPALILGRHVLPYFDNKPGRHIGAVVDAAYEAQADGAFSTEEEALRWLEEYLRRTSED